MVFYGFSMVLAILEFCISEGLRQDLKFYNFQLTGGSRSLDKVSCFSQLALLQEKRRKIHKRKDEEVDPERV